MNCWHPLGTFEKDLPAAVVVYWQVAPDYSSDYRTAFRVDTIPCPDGHENDGFSAQFPPNESLLLIY